MLEYSIGALIIPMAAAGAQLIGTNPQLDRSKPVPAKSEVIAAWQKRQSAITTFNFAWTEEQVHPTGWLSNPRYPERERAAIAGLRVDRRYVVTKTLEVDGKKLRYGFEIDRAEEADGIRVSSQHGANNGLGVRRKYSYVGAFDGQVETIRLTSLLGSPPPTVRQVTANIDGQNLDARAILMAFRPLDAEMGHLLLDRAVTNLSRTFYRGKSTFLLEERHDPSGWKTMLWIEPERDFLVSRYMLLFEQSTIVDVEIDHVRDTRWGWIPNAWRVTEMLSDGSKRLVSSAKVSNYNINVPSGAGAFR